jgi:hypothetical protein
MSGETVIDSHGTEYLHMIISTGFDSPAGVISEFEARSHDHMLPVSRNR